MNRSVAVWKCVMALALCAVLAGGCTKDEPTKPSTTVDPNAPPPPTPEELSKQAITELGLDQPLPPPGSRLVASVRATTISQFQTKHAELSATPEGQAALKLIQKVLEEKIDAFQKGGYWEYVITYADIYAIFQPQSKKYEQAKEKATIELRKPRVTVHGLPEVNGHQMALLKIYIPLTSETFDERLSIGDDAYGVKFLGVFGNGRGVRLEYLETGERFVAYLKSQK